MSGLRDGRDVRVVGVAHGGDGHRRLAAGEPVLHVLGHYIYIYMYMYMYVYVYVYIYIYIYIHAHNMFHEQRSPPAINNNSYQ